MARSFNGTTDQIATTLQVQSFYAGAGSSVVTSFVYSAWVLLQAGAGSFPMLMQNNNTSLNSLFFGQNIGNASSAVGVNMYINSLQSLSTSALTTGVWHHVAARFTDNGSATGTITIFVDGSDVTSGNTGTMGFTGGDTSTMNIADGSGGNSNWDGNIADFAVWTHVTGVDALTNNEIIALSKGARPHTVRPLSLVGNWALDGLSSPEPDYSSKARNGTLTGTAKVAGPPVALFTRRWPQFAPFNAPAVPNQPFTPFEMPNTWRIPRVAAYRVR